MKRIIPAMLLALIGAGPAGAQVVNPSVIAVLSECPRATCQRGVTIAVLQLRRSGISGDDFNAQLGMLAATLFDAARNARERRTSQRVSVAILRLAANSSDRQQRRSFVSVARAMRRDAEELFERDNPFSVSPS